MIKIFKNEKNLENYGKKYGFFLKKLNYIEKIIKKSELNLNYKKFENIILTNYFDFEN